MKRVISVVLVFTMLFSLAACGGKSNDAEDPNVGNWIPAFATVNGVRVEDEVLFEEGMSLFLKADGSYTFIWDGDTEHGKWSLKNGGFTLIREDGDFTGTIENGILKIVNILDLGMDITFEKEGGYAKASIPNETPQEQPAIGKGLNKIQEWWDGEWFGYWETHSETDGYTDFEGGRWESYTLIDMNPDDTGTIYMWDENGDFARTEIKVNKDGGQGHMGAAISESGNLWFGAEIGHADWIIDPSLYGHENYMVIDGRYEDDDGGGFNYIFYLKPWGELWEGFEEDEMPPMYDDWYLTTYDKTTMQQAILDHDGPIHSEIAHVSNKEKPSASAPAVSTSVDIAGERIKSDNISAICPIGWTSYEALDYEDKPIENSLEFHINAEGTDGKYLKPGLSIWYYDEDYGFTPPEKWFAGKSQDWGPINLGGRTWEGYYGLDPSEREAYIWAKQGNGYFSIIAWLEIGEEDKISLEHEDVLGIISSIKFD